MTMWLHNFICRKIYKVDIYSTVLNRIIGNEVFPVFFTSENF